MTKDCINHWVINPLQKSTINSLLDDKWDWSSNVLKEKTEGRKSQSLPFLLSKNMRKYTLKNAGFCPNKVIHFTDNEGRKVDSGVYYYRLEEDKDRISGKLLMIK